MDASFSPKGSQIESNIRRLARCDGTMKLKSIAESIILAVGLVFVLSSVLNYSFIRNSTNNGCSDVDSYKSLVNSVGPTHSISTTCYLPRKLIFLKTHKTASSTLSGILWHELCERDNLNCFLPPYSNPGRTWDFESMKDLVYMHKSKGTLGTGPPFDVWLHHARMHESIHQVVRGDSDRDAIQFMSIVRHPAMRFRSAWNWYMLSNWFYPSSFTFSIFNTNYTFGVGVQPMSLENFASLHPPDCTQHSAAHSVKKKQSILDYAWSCYVQYISRNYFNYRTGLDATAEELVGLRRQDPGFEPGFKDLLQRIVAGKVLLLVTDRFDESLLVMRQLMLAHPHPSINTTATTMHNHTSDAYFNDSDSHSVLTNDIPLHHLLYLRQKKQNKVDPLSETTVLNLMHLQPFDTLLYQAANSMLDQYIARFYGDNITLFHEELSWLRSELAVLEIMCSEQHHQHIEIQHSESQEESLAQQSPLTHIGTVKQSEQVGSRIYQEKYRLLCGKLRRDNKDLVREAWDAMQAAKK